MSSGGAGGVTLDDHWPRRNPPVQSVFSSSSTGCHKYIVLRCFLRHSHSFSFLFLKRTWTYCLCVETEAQRSQATCSRPCSWVGAGCGLEPGCLGFVAEPWCSPSHPNNQRNCSFWNLFSHSSFPLPPTGKVGVGGERRGRGVREKALTLAECLLCAMSSQQSTSVNFI